MIDANMNCSVHDDSNTMMASGTSNELTVERRGPCSVSAARHRSPREAQSGAFSDHEVYTASRCRTPSHLSDVTRDTQNTPESPVSRLTKSWNGSISGPSSSNTHDFLGQPIVMETSLSKAQPNQRHADFSPNGLLPANPQHGAPVAEEEGEKDGNGSQRRVQRRLMWSIILALMFYLTALMSLIPILSQYLFRRFVMERFNLTNLTIRQTPCAKGENSSFQDELNTIQGKTSQQMLYLDYSQYVPAIVVSLLVGSYADYLGRKFLVFVPMVGGFFKSGVILLVVYMDLEINYLYIGFMIDGLLGSFYALQVGVLASVADVTITARQRVLLIAMIDVSVGLSGALSQIGTGYLIDALGFDVPCLVVSSLFFLGCVCILFCMPETLHNRPQNLVLNPLVHLRKVFSFYLWDGSLLQRALFMCGQVILFLVTMVNLGRMPVENLFVMNTPFCWSSIHIGFFFGIRLLVQNVGSIIFLKILSKWVRLELIGMLGLLCGAASFIVQGLAETDIMMYITIVVGFIISLVSPIVRTLLSRMVPAKSQGALFASMSAVETVCHLTAASLYNGVYTATLDYFPGAVFLLTAGLLFFDVILLIWFTVTSRKFPNFQEVQIEVKANADDDAVSPSMAPTPSICEDDETAPLLSNKSNSVT